MSYVPANLRSLPPKADEPDCCCVSASLNQPYWRLLQSVVAIATDCSKEGLVSAPPKEKKKVSGE